MGQQQLLLVILVTIIVGIATVVAMNVFGTAAEDANRDAVRLDLLQGATAAQAIYVRPRILDGAGQDFTSIEANLLRRLSLPITSLGDGIWGNENGTYSIEDVTAHGFTIRAKPSGGGRDIVAVILRDTASRSWDVSIRDDGDE